MPFEFLPTHFSPTGHEEVRKGPTLAFPFVALGGCDTRLGLTHSLLHCFFTVCFAPASRILHLFLLSLFLCVLFAGLFWLCNAVAQTAQPVTIAASAAFNYASALSAPLQGCFLH